MHPRPGSVSTFWRRSLHSAPCLTEMCHCSWERTNCSCHWCWVCSLSKWNIWSLVNRVKRRCPTTCCFNPGVLTLAGVCLWRSSALSKLLIGLILVLHQNLFSFSFKLKSKAPSAGACPGPRSAVLIPQELLHEQRDRSHLYSSSLYQPHIHTGLYSVHFMHIISMTTLEWPFTQACMSWLWED